MNIKQKQKLKGEKKIEGKKDLTKPTYLLRAPEKLLTSTNKRLIHHPTPKPFHEDLNGVNRQPSNGPKINGQPLKTEYFSRQPSNERAKIDRQISQISLNDRDRLT